MKKRKGQIGTVTVFFFIIFVLIIVMYELQLYTYQAISTAAEDALTASNLASAVIDLQEYGKTHDIIIADPEEAYHIYMNALKVNMGLDDFGNCTSQPDISGPVTVQEYIIYNVRGEDVDIYHFGESRFSQLITGGKGRVTAPNGKVIESTSVYSRITFQVDGIWGIHTTAVKDALADIVT